MTAHPADGGLKIRLAPRYRLHRRRIEKAIRKARRKFTEADDLEALGEVQAGDVVIGPLRP